jgi:hypothetical protein
MGHDGIEPPVANQGTDKMLDARHTLPTPRTMRELFDFTSDPVDREIEYIELEERPNVRGSKSRELLEGLGYYADELRGRVREDW